MLITKGADVNVKLKSGSMIKDNKPYRAKSGETTLHTVARSYSEKHASKVCELLIASGAKVNELNVKGQTPLDEALPNGRKKTAEILRKHGGKMEEELKAKKQNETTHWNSHNFCAWDRGSSGGQGADEPKRTGKGVEPYRLGQSYFSDYKDAKVQD